MIANSIFSEVYDTYKIKKPIRLIELFAGIGSQAMALRDINKDFENYKVIEFDKFAMDSYNAIHHTTFMPTDITTIKGNDLEIIDTEKFEYIMTYSFPCQDLSLSGKQRGMKKGSGTRSGLLWEVERLLNETSELPQILLMENVTQVHNDKNISDFSNWIAYLESRGYKSYYRDLNAKDFGIPQNRKRCFMISILGNYNYIFPKNINCKKSLVSILENDVDNKYFINKKKSDKVISQLGSLLNTSQKMTILVSNKGSHLDRVTTIASTLMARDYKGFGNQSFNAVIDKLNGEFQLRKLTPLEYWRLMGFTDNDFRNAEKISSDTQLYKQAGNSIVKNVLMSIFNQLF